MSHNIVGGGFGSSKKGMDYAAEQLSRYYNEEFVGVPLRDSMDDNERFRRLVKGARVFTHSAGMVALRDTQPERIIAFTPPVPVPAPDLVRRALQSAVEFAGAAALYLDKDGVWCANELVRELSRHAYGHIRHLGRIASFNALEMGVDAVDSGIPTALIFMTHDKLFMPEESATAHARLLGVKVTTMPGGHEQFIAKPYQTVSSYETYRFSEL